MAETLPARRMMERERMRLGQVRKAFAAGLEKAVIGETVSIEFFAAAVDYIKAAMDRLHAQDQRIHDMLRPHVPAGDAEGRATLADLDARLDASRPALESLAAARDRFRAAGDGGLKAFEAAAAKFMDIYFNVLLKGQHSTLPLQERHFDAAAWTAVSGQREDALQKEAALFALVRKFAPPGADPDSMAAGPPGARPSP